MYITASGLNPLIDNVNSRYVQPEYLLAPPDAEEKPIVIKEPWSWFWQKKKKEERKDGL
jgi:hypothetical protein